VQHGLHRKIGWVDAFWVASGVPALVLLSLGAIAATVGKPSWVVWMVSITFGFLQSFTYAEIAGLFPNKSGGASVFGAIAWVRYEKHLAPVSVWCNWLAWSPVLAIGSGLGAGYILSILFSPDAPINAWQLTLVDLGWIKKDLTLRINATSVIGTALMLFVFAIQHRGILKAAKMQMLLGISALVPLLFVGILPLLSGRSLASNLFPLHPIAKDAAGKIIDGPWDLAGWTLMAGGLFIAAWSTYAFETAVCYTREFKNPNRDTFRAIFYSGLLCVVVFTLVPLAFQGELGLEGMLAPDIYSGAGVAKALAHMVGGSNWVEIVLVVMMILALVLSIMTAMAGSSRTLYQASVDGWLPKYLSHVNESGAPTRAMWTDLGFNLTLLLMSDYVFVLAISNVAYIVFNFLNLHAGWIHRIDRSQWSRPFRCPDWLLAAGAVLSFVNLALLGIGADIWGAGTLVSGLVCVAMVIPVFLYRHYVTDKGKFPEAMIEDMHLGDVKEGERRAGILPYATLVAGIIVVWVSHSIAVYH
jgi:amino acid transporter